VVLFGLPFSKPFLMFRQDVGRHLLHELRVLELLLDFGDLGLSFFDFLKEKVKGLKRASTMVLFVFRLRTG
jgi:hypothetical protein